MRPGEHLDNSEAAGEIEQKPRQQLNRKAVGSHLPWVQQQES